MFHGLPLYYIDPAQQALSTAGEELNDLGDDLDDDLSDLSIRGVKPIAFGLCLGQRASDRQPVVFGPKTIYRHTTTRLRPCMTIASLPHHRRAPFRHCTDARVYRHKATAMHDHEEQPPWRNLAH